VIGVVVGAVVLTILTLVTIVVWKLVGPLLQPTPQDDAPAESEEVGP
jgi:hypothetical protein